MFEQFEPFSWDKLRERSDWSVVTGITVLVTGLLMVALAIAGWTLSSVS